MIWFDALTGAIGFVIQVGGSIHDVGITLAVWNGKALMTGNSVSPVITVSSTYDILLFEID